METNEEYNLENFMLITLLPLTIAAIAGLIYTWVLTCEQVRAVKALAWPQTIALLSVGSVPAFPCQGEESSALSPRR